MRFSGVQVLPSALCSVSVVLCRVVGVHVVFAVVNVSCWRSA